MRCGVKRSCRRLLLPCSRRLRRPPRRSLRLRRNPKRVKAMALERKGAVLRDRPPRTAAEAMASLIDVQGMKTPAIRDRIDTVSYDGLPLPLVDFMRALKREMERYRIPMAFHEGWRSAGRQHQLMVEGVSKARGGESPHQYGLAFDYVHAVRGWKLSPLEWAQIGSIGHEVARKRNIPIEWGGDWKFYDPAHWQIKGWRKWKSVMDAKEMDEARRPALEEWKQIVSRVEPALYKRTWPFG